MWLRNHRLQDNHTIECVVLIKMTKITSEIAVLVSEQKNQSNDFSRKRQIPKYLM